MTRVAATLFTIVSLSCAARSPYSFVYDSAAVAEWRGGSADRCVFGNVTSLCLRSVVAPSGAEGLDQFVVAGIRQHLPEFQNTCSATVRTEVQALLGASGCIDCGAGARVPIEASAAVLAFETGIGKVDTIEWVDERGGTFEQVATRLGAAVGAFVVEAASQCMPPNKRMKPAALGQLWHHPDTEAPRLMRGR